MSEGRTPLSKPGWKETLRAAGCLAVATMALAAAAQNGGESYFEFGTVVALGKHDVDVQTFDPQRQRLVQRSYALGKATQADAVHVGDTVEVIYQAGPAGTEWMLNRLLLIHGEVPKAGPAASGPAVDVAPREAAAPVVSAKASAEGTAPVAVVPAKKPVTTTRAGRSTAAPANAASGSTTSSSMTGTLAKTAKPGGTSANPAPVALGAAAKKVVPGAVAIPLGVSGDAAALRAPKLKGVTQEAPGQQCGRDADWSTLPISMAVLDFRYPTEHEEANDVSKTGGGSGTAVADLVYNQLAAGQPEFQMRRGDREKLFRMDFAGAARLGRQIGVDLVLLGTFEPVEVVSPDPAYPNPTQAYTLRAGVVETCTGQLLYKLTSITCAAAASGGPPPARGSVPPSCPGSEIAVKDTLNPRESEGAYRVPIEMLLQPLLHNGTPAGVIGSAGVVTAAAGNSVTIRVGPQGVKVGEQVSIHSFRLAKNPTTNTLQRFEDMEMGRMTVTQVNGGSATGTYLGDVAPKAGDTAEVITE